MKNDKNQSFEEIFWNGIQKGHENENTNDNNSPNQQTIWEIKQGLAAQLNSKHPLSTGIDPETITTLVAGINAVSGEAHKQQGITFYNRERNKAESRGTSESRESGAKSQESRAMGKGVRELRERNRRIRELYKIKIQDIKDIENLNELTTKFTTLKANEYYMPEMIKEINERLNDTFDRAKDSNSPDLYNAFCAIYKNFSKNKDIEQALNTKEMQEKLAIAMQKVKEYDKTKESKTQDKSQSKTQDKNKGLSR